MERMNELARSCNCACDKHERSQAAGPCMHGGKHAHSRHSSPAGHQLRLRTCLFIAASIKLVDRPSEDAHYSISNSARLFVLLMVVEQSKQPLRCCLPACTRARCRHEPPCPPTGPAGGQGHQLRVAPVPPVGRARAGLLGGARATGMDRQLPEPLPHCPTPTSPTLSHHAT